MWLYVPFAGSPCAPGPEGLSAASRPPLPSSAFRTSAFATSSGKPSRRRLSWPGWRTRPWIALLSGMTSRPSELRAGVDAWILSRQDTLARPFPSLAAGRDPQTPATSGPTSRGSSEPSGQLWAKTPHASDAEGGIMEIRPGTKGHYKANARPLNEVVDRWPSPRSNDFQGDSPNAKAVKGKLNHMVPRWQTPSNADTLGGHLSRSGARKGELLLKGQAKAWTTPKFSDPDKPSAVKGTTSDLSHQAQRTRGGLESLSGAPGSRPPSKRRLNPAFVEWLMGWEIGWSLPCAGALTASAYAETASSGPARRWPSGNCGEGLFVQITRGNVKVEYFISWRLIDDCRRVREARHG